MENKKGFVFDDTSQWNKKYNKWKKIIKAYLYYETDTLSKRDLEEYTKYHRIYLNPVIKEFVEENILIELPASPNSKHFVYKLNWEEINRRKMFDVVKDNKYVEYLYQVELYILYEQRGEEFFLEALCNGLRYEEDISKFIIQRLEEVLNEKYRRKGKRRNKH